MKEAICEYFGIEPDVYPSVKPFLKEFVQMQHRKVQTLSFLTREGKRHPAKNYGYVEIKDGRITHYKDRV